MSQLAVVGGAEKRKTGHSPRLIEQWLPIAKIGIESLRERTPMTPFPAPNRLHVWWARRPLVASRAAILASLLPANADRERFLHVLGIHGDPVAAKERMVRAGKNVDPETGEREDLGANPYGYDRAFKYIPKDAEIAAVQRPFGGAAVVIDPTAGGGSIPFEASRLGCSTLANDLNPVAWLILKATVEFPAQFGQALVDRYKVLSAEFMRRAETRFEGMFAPEPEGVTVDGYLWARTIHCPYCGGLVPLSPNWRLDSSGVGVKLVPQTVGLQDRHCTFEMVDNLQQQSEATVTGGEALCPFPDCHRVIEGDEIKRQAQAGQMGEQLFTVVYTERKVIGYTKNRKPKIKKIRGFRAPRKEDDVEARVKTRLDEKMPEWQARNIVPDEAFPDTTNDDRPLQYGMALWRDMFSPRQLLGHCTSVEVFHELMDECGGVGVVGDLDAAALTYLALALDKMLNWNARMSSWNVNAGRLRSVFDRHDFSLTWSYGEMAPCLTGGGFRWVLEETGKALQELVDLCRRSSDVPSDHEAPIFGGTRKSGTEDHGRLATISLGSGDNLSHVSDASVDAVVMDPPYYDNVMYAELADFFYVWLKRTAGLLYPEQFSSYLTDKDREAVANPAKFKDFSSVRGSGGAKKRASRDYQERMQAIFAECRRVLKPDGVLTLMFTHKATGAWDALAKGLVDAGFEITASWPIQTEAEGSLHIKDKNAAKSTIFLVCRPREAAAANAEATYWENIEPLVKEVVRKKVAIFQAAGIGGVDLYLACFGPALEIFSEHWPMTRAKANQRPMAARGAQLQLIEDEEWDAYAVRPEDALMAARSAVKEWRLEQLTTVKRQVHLDPVTEWFVLAWDAYKSPQFPADEALKLARVVGVNFDEKLKGKVLEVKGGDVILWDSSLRMKKEAAGGMSGEVMLDALHHAARIARDRNITAAKDLIDRAELGKSGTFLMALEALLNVLPTPRETTGDAKGPIAAAAADAQMLEQLRKLMFNAEVPQAKQWVFWEESESSTK